MFDINQGYADMPMKVPCGKCIGCRLEYSRQWAVRCVHEAQLHEDNCFITLTYCDSQLPTYGSLVKKDFQDFMKRLRFKYAPKSIRFFHCGEYGATTGRAHYHALLFGHDFADKVLFQVRQGTRLYVSASLDSLWGRGFSTVGALTFESAAYVARYVTKKVDGNLAFTHYNHVDYETGEVTERLPEYCTMSRRPGIGRGWFDLYGSETFRDDSVVLRGKEMRPPKYYDALYEHVDPDHLLKIKARRLKRAKATGQEQTFERLRVREVVKKAQLSQLKRTL